MAKKLTIRKRGKHYWITGMPRYYADGKSCTECGPYATKEEASSDREGMQRTLDRIGWTDEEERPQGEAKADGSGSRKVVRTQTFQEIVEANKPTSHKPVIKEAKRKPVVEEGGFW